MWTLCFCTEVLNTRRLEFLVSIDRHRLQNTVPACPVPSHALGTDMSLSRTWTLRWKTDEQVNGVGDWQSITSAHFGPLAPRRSRQMQQQTRGAAVRVVQGFEHLQSHSSMPYEFRESPIRFIKRVERWEEYYSYYTTTTTTTTTSPIDYKHAFVLCMSLLDSKIEFQGHGCKLRTVLNTVEYCYC